MSKYKFLLRFLKPYPSRVFLTILFGFSGALFNGVGTTLIVPIILQIVGQNLDLRGAPPIIQIVTKPFDQVPTNYRLAVMASAILLIIIFKNLASYIGTLVASSLTRTLTSDMRETGVKILLEIDMDYYTKMKVGDLINSLGGEIGRTASAIGTFLKLIIIIITILVFIGLLLSISWQLTIASTILLSLVTLINQYSIYRSRDFGTQLTEMSKAYSISLLEMLNGIRLVKATGNEEREYKQIKHLIRQREKADFQSQVNSEIIAPISEVTGMIALILIVLLGRALFADQISSLSAVLITYLFLLLRLLPFISQLNTIRSSFANMASSIDVVTDFLQRDNKPFMGNGTISYQKLEQGVHFNHLYFSYPEHESLVLQDVDLYLPKGTTLALVGSSGAGKSTMADLLPRFYDPTSGSITLDGIDLRQFDLKTVRKAMGIVSQDTFLFNDSVGNNIGYGKPGASQEEILQASKRANAYEFISKLPQGFDTQVGDRGVMLSGGQRQRLAIARALLQNPEILILDEATSALDTVSERLVQSALDELSRDRTTLVIAHRLSTVQKADQIAVLDQGRVVETGTHTELLQKGGYYSRLYSMQFGDRAEPTARRDPSLIRISYELRTRLNSMIGFLGLLLDDLVDSAQEREELIEESYNSALRVLNTIEILDDVVTLKKNWDLFSNQDGENSEQQKLNRFFNEFRNCLYPLINSLRLLVNNPEHGNYSEYNNLIQDCYQSTIYLLDTLKIFEDRKTQKSGIRSQEN